MHQRQRLGVQSLTSEGDAATPPPVNRVADERMSDRSEVDTNLVRAAGFEAACEQRRVGIPRAYVEMRDRRFAAAYDRHACAMSRVAPDGRLHGIRPLDAAMHKRCVLATNRSCLQLAHEIGLRGERPGDDKEPARVLVETMNDTGTGQGGKRRRMLQQRVQ
jgi:hypothetical protein